jgi:hypothetical protein
MKFIVEQRVNIMAAHHMMDTWLVIHSANFNALIPKQLQYNFRFYPCAFNGDEPRSSPVKRPDALIGTRTGDPATSPLCCSKTGYNSRSESISIAVRLEANRGALNCCHSVDRATSKKKRLLTNYKPE